MDAQRPSILVINGKGGCGKTTVATNLAAALAARGEAVALIDQDPLAGSCYWAERRAEQLPAVQVSAHAAGGATAANEDCNAQAHLIIDGAASGDSLTQWLPRVDLVLIPVLPAAIDLHMSAAFVRRLQELAAATGSAAQLAVVANRVQPNTESEAQLLPFLEQLALQQIPCVATLRDSPLYSQALGQGRGIVDLQAQRAARKECATWWQLLEWLAAQSQPATGPATERRQPPQAAGRHERGQGRASA